MQSYAAPRRPIRFGVFPGAVQVTWPELVRIWRAVDSMGYDTAWIPDHFYAGWGDPAGPSFEAWTSLAALAASTRRIRLGTMVTGNTFRHPAVLANMAATVDHISFGRLDLGIGAGWMEAEHRAYGIPLPPPRERLDRLDEAVQVLRLLFTEPRATFRGAYFQLDDAMCEPKPIQKPYPRLVIGGHGEKRTLRIVARYADEWNGELSPHRMREKIAVLHEHCRALGRDPAALDVSVLVRVESEAESTYAAMLRFGNLNFEAERKRLVAEGVGPADLDGRLRAEIFDQFLPTDDARAIDWLNSYVAAGVTHFVVVRRPPYDVRTMEQFLSRVAPHVSV